MLYQHSALESSIAPDDIVAHVCAAMASLPSEGKRVLCIIPDHTRSMPMPEVFRAVVEAVGPRAAELNFLIALGTHPPMSEAMIAEHLGAGAEEGGYRVVGAGSPPHPNPLPRSGGEGTRGRPSVVGVARSETTPQQRSYRTYPLVAQYPPRAWSYWASCPRAVSSITPSR